MSAMSRVRLTRAQAKERTRGELLDAAAKVFSERGYEGASVAEIAERAGRTTGAIYAHFPTKEALFLALLAERYARAPYRAANIPADHTDVIDHVADWFTADSSPTDGWNLLLLEFFLFSIRNPELTVEYRDRIARGRDSLATMLEGLFAEGANAPPLPPAQLATLILAIQDGLRLQHQADPDLPIRDLYAYALRRITGS